MISCSQSLLVSLVAPAAAQAAGGYQCCRKRREGDLGTKGPQRGAPAWVVPGELRRWNGWKWMEMVNGWVGWWMWVSCFAVWRGYTVHTYINICKERERETYRDIKRHKDIHIHILYTYIYCFQIQKQNGTLEPLLLLGCKSKHKHGCCRCLAFMKICIEGWKSDECGSQEFSDMSKSRPLLNHFDDFDATVFAVLWWPGGRPLPAEVPQIVNDGVTIARAITLQVQFSEGFPRFPKFSIQSLGLKKRHHLRLTPKGDDERNTENMPFCE